MSGGGSGDSTVTNKTELDPITKKWRTQLFDEGKDLYAQGPLPYFPGSTVVPFSGQTQAGLGQLQSQAEGGAVNYGAANDAAGRSLSGEGYAPAMALARQTAETGGGQNPYLDSVFSSMSGRVSDAVNANFAKAGRSGPNAAHTGALTRGLGDLANSIYMPAFESQQNRALQGVGMMGELATANNQDAARTQALLPSIWSYGAQPGQQMLGVGGANEALSQEQLADQQSRYYYPQTSQWDMLNQYSVLMNGIPQTSNNSQTGAGAQPNRAMSALGGAMSGAQMGSSFGPWGTAAGAVAGGLFGGYA
jgi:hypothetical protein